MRTVRAYLGLGSNLDDRLSNLLRSVELLNAFADISVVRSSRVYETVAVGPPQPDYLNAVVEAETSRPPRTLLDACLAVEREMGRDRGLRWGPRVIDVDLLTYAEETIEEPGLTVPHPRMHERAFVLAPLLELDADPTLPGGRSLGALRLGPAALLDVRPFAPALVSALGSDP